MKIWIINHYAVTPDQPGGSRHYDLACQLADHGHEVTVFASGFNYITFSETQDYGKRKFVKEIREGFNWFWIKTTPYRQNDPKRFFNMLSFTRGFKKLINNEEAPDIILASTVHPFAPRVMSKFAKRKHIPFVFEIRDLWPQTLIDNGSWSKSHPLAILFRNIEKNTIKRSDSIVVLSPKTIGYLNKKYSYPKDKVLLLPNSTNITQEPQPKTIINDKLKFMYAGGVDTVHKLDDLIRALEILKPLAGKFTFEVVGRGKDMENLQVMSKNAGIENLIWNGPVNKNEVAEKLHSADILFLSTGEVYYGSENKLGEYLNAAKPIITYTPAKHNDPTQKIGCGFSADYGNIEQLASTILKMINTSKQEREIMSGKGYAYARKNLNIEVLGAQLEKFLKKTIENAS